MEGIRRELKVEARSQIGSNYRAEGNFELAKLEYAKILKMEEATPEYKELVEQRIRVICVIMLVLFVCEGKSQGEGYQTGLETRDALKPNNNKRINPFIIEFARQITRQIPFSKVVPFNNQTVEIFQCGYIQTASYVNEFPVKIILCLWYISARGF